MTFFFLNEEQIKWKVRKLIVQICNLQPISYMFRGHFVCVGGGAFCKLKYQEYNYGIV